MRTSIADQSYYSTRKASIDAFQYFDIAFASHIPICCFRLLTFKLINHKYFLFIIYVYSNVIAFFEICENRLGIDRNNHVEIQYVPCY